MPLGEGEDEIQRGNLRELFLRDSSNKMDGGKSNHQLVLLRHRVKPKTFVITVALYFIKIRLLSKEALAVRLVRNEKIPQ